MDQEVGSPFQDRMRKAGLGGSFAVENVGAGYHTLADAFSGWRDSPPHRANMLNRGVTRMGVAAAYAPASKYKVFWARDYRRGGRGRKGSLGIRAVFAIASSSASRAYSSVSPNVHPCRSETIDRRSTVTALASISTIT
jgi:hypothetical protein